MSDHDALLDLMIRKGPALRAAGYQSFMVSPDGTVSATLAPPDLPAPVVPKDSDHKFSPANALDDPDTFGGEMPKRRPIFERDGDE